MNANTYMPGNDGGIIGGSSIVGQLVTVLIFLIVLYVIYFGAEGLYRSYSSYNKSVVDLMPITYSSEAKSYVISQNPRDSGAKPISLSDNERTGIEFSYAFFIYINPSGFRQEEGLMHVFHKGYSKQYPLLGPGVYIKSNENTLRCYMNSTATWNSYCDVENIPVQKWVHVAIVGRANGMEIYINGDLAKRMTFAGGVPYQNYQDIYVFSQRTVQMLGDDVTGTNKVASLDGKSFRVFGAFRGMLSCLRYFNYALSYTEIAAMISEGPSKKMESQSQDQPPYLVDNWWISGK
jgi:hypothetical protein